VWAVTQEVLLLGPVAALLWWVHRSRSRPAQT
jgi:hypothetical protein